MHGAGNWVKIAAHVSHGVSRQQCYRWWARYLKGRITEAPPKPNVLKKGSWDADEVRTVSAQWGK